MRRYCSRLIAAPVRGPVPIWGHRRAGRSVAEPVVAEETPAELAPTLHLQWVRDLPPLRPAWPDQPTLQYDVAYQPVVAGKTLFLASSRADGVAAFDAETGDALWRFFTDGPVRFAPVVWQDKVYFASDDGCLYCVAADAGELVWKFRGGPSDRKILGNGASSPPGRRGAPTVVQEPNGEAVVYFAAGIWPFMGVFLHALDARTGAVRWTNDGDGSMYIKQPHQVDSFAGVAPQGRLVAVGDRLLVPGGRSVPACYDRHTGKLLHFRLADNSKIRRRRRRVVAGRGLLRQRRRGLQLSPRAPSSAASAITRSWRATCFMPARRPNCGPMTCGRPASPVGSRSRPIAVAAARHRSA